MNQVRDINEATIRELAKKSTNAHVLKYFLEVDDLSYAQEISDAIREDPAKVSFSLFKLSSCGLIIEEEQTADSRVKYFRILDKASAKLVVDRYERMKGREFEVKQGRSEAEEV
jgi:DNA-binding MarR family transcriptional regulator